MHGHAMANKTLIFVSVVVSSFPLPCSLAEIPECRMQIAADKEVLKQLVVTLVTPCYNSIASLVAMAGMLCLAYRYMHVTCMLQAMTCM